MTFDFVLDKSFPAARHYVTGVYEPETASIICQVLKPGDVAIDVGANIGYFTCLMAHLVGPTGRVFSFEPSELNLKHLRNNVSVNNFDMVDIIPYPVGLMENTPVVFWECLDDTSGSSLWDPGLWHENVAAREAPRPRELLMVTLKTCPVKPRLIKIDVEGAEEFVLRGAPLDHWGLPLIIAEWNPFAQQQMGSSPERMRAYAEELGYSTWIPDSRGSFPRFVPRGIRLEFAHIFNVIFATERQIVEFWPLGHVDFRDPT